MIIKKNTFYIAVFLVIVLVGAFFFIRSSGSTPSNPNNPSGAGDIQKITLSMKNGNYYPNTVTVKVNQPVRIYLDSSVGGCYRSFTLRDFNIAKNLKTPQDYVEFTPTKKGTFGFACSMGMGTGTLIVE